MIDLRTGGGITCTRFRQGMIFESRTMTENRQGQVVTFYSYNGGTGRTMAIANVAWILAANGKRVLVADWDLESPGLHRFFGPFIDGEAFAHKGGVIDLIREFEWATTKESDRRENWYEQYARVRTYAFGLSWNFPSGGTLDFLSAGRQNIDYAASIQGLDWDEFYEHLGGGQFLDALRADMKYNYDYTLIDSRTGVSDVAEICTIQLPDVLVACFTLSEQSISGAAQVARMVQQRYDARNIRILPVPMRVDRGERVKATAGQQVAMRRFAGMPSGLTDDERSRYWAEVAVPYEPAYAYEEILATFADEPGSPRTLLSAYENLVRHISGGAVTALPDLDAAVRHEFIDRFTRRANLAEERVTLRYAGRDQVWAEWIGQVLLSANVRVDDDGPTAGTAAGAVLLDGRGEGRPPLAVYLSDVATVSAFAEENSAFVYDQPADVAAARVLRLVGVPSLDADLVSIGRAARFPGGGAEVSFVPVRNPRFTGREDDLRRLRAGLRTGGVGAGPDATRTVVLQGMGGVGKTQLALEYAHRFGAAYDAVLWIAAGSVALVEMALVELGARLGPLARPGATDLPRTVLRALAGGEPYGRWLVIFDGADDPEQVAPFLPRGTGHVLVTSRNPAWGAHAQPIQVEVFPRQESIAHLRQWVPAITTDEAYHLAERLGDLPTAVASAAAALAGGDAGVDDFLRHLDRDGPVALALATTWELSLAQLRERSPAAHRLLQLCSVLAGEIPLELVYRDELGAALTLVDPALADSMMRGLLIQQLNRLALLRIERTGGEPAEPAGQGASIQVHRLLQHLVRSRMSADELAEARHQMHLVLAASRPRGDVDDPQTWPGYGLLWAHLDASEAVTCTAEAVHRLLLDRVRYLRLTGAPAEGGQLADRIDGIWTARLGQAMASPARLALHRELLHLRYQRARILRDQAEFTASRALDQAVLAEQRQLLGDHHPHALITAGGLAADLRALGHYGEALRLDEVTHAAWSRQFGDDHPGTLTALSSLATSHRVAGGYRAARERARVALDRRRLILGARHPDTLGSAGDLGRDLRETGEFELSVERLREVLTTFIEVLGPRSRGAVNAGANLAVSLRMAGHLHEAADALELAYEQLNDTLGPTNPDTLSCRLSRSVTLLALGERERATTELDAVRVAYERGLGPDHPYTLVCGHNLAAAAHASGEHHRARGLGLSTADALGRALGPNHPYVLLATMNLAVFVADDGELVRAAELIARVTGRLVEVLGPDHPDTLCCRANQAIILGDLRRPGPAADEARPLEALAHRIGAGHPVLDVLRGRRRVHRVIDPHPY